MLQFQVLTPATTTSTKATSSTSRRSIPSNGQDSGFLVLTHEPAEAVENQNRRESAFLVLAPVTSDTYPTARNRENAAIVFSPTDFEASTSPASSPLLSPTTTTIPVDPKPRRSTSISSSGSNEAKRRFLKLNPVHDGGEEGVDDYAVEE